MKELQHEILHHLGDAVKEEVFQQVLHPPTQNILV